jgi:hypothetical protein
MPCVQHDLGLSQELAHHLQKLFRLGACKEVSL